MNKKNTSGSLVEVVTISAMFTALAVILSYIESIVPFNFGIPGVKLGLANLVIIIAIYEMNYRQAIIINAVRIIIIGAMFGSLFSIAYSLTGAAVSLLIMIIFKKFNFNIISVSVMGGIFHNIGQLLVAALVIKTYSVILYTPVLLVSGFITGALLGFIADIIRRRFHGIIHKG